jgi:DNA-directed RNA polymerase subunit RPC12/RpoP
LRERRKWRPTMSKILSKGEAERANCTVRNTDDYEELVESVDRLLESHEVLREQVERLEAEQTCEWTFDDYHCTYDTECGSIFQPEENLSATNTNYCPYCGGWIKEKEDD